MTDITTRHFNNSTYDTVATIGRISATTRAGVSNADGEFQVGVIPANSLITKTYLRVTEAFDGTSPTVSVGTTGTATKWFSATTVAAKNVTVGTKLLDKTVDVAEAITMTLVNGTSTVGAAEVIVEYIDLDNRREMFTQ